MIQHELLFRETKMKLEANWQEARRRALVPRTSARHGLAVTLRRLAARLEPEEESLAHNRYAHP